MNDSLRIAVISGGDSTEAAVSRNSGRAVETALRASFLHVEHCEFDADLPARLVAGGIDVVFPVLHGGKGENGCFQGFLEILGIAYVGSGVTACALAMDKALAKCVMQGAGVPVADGFRTAGEDIEPYVALALERFQGNGCVVKPNSAGSALGMSFCNTEDEIRKGLALALSFSSSALIEQWFIGREITVAIVEDENDVLLAFPPVEIVTPTGQWFDYEHRYTPGASRHICPAELPEAVSKRVQHYAMTAHQAIGCRDYSRVDLLVNKVGNALVLELNAIPGMTEISLFPDAAQSAGYDFVELVRLLVSRAVKRRRS